MAVLKNGNVTVSFADTYQPPENQTVLYNALGRGAAQNQGGGFNPFGWVGDKINAAANTIGTTISAGADALRSGLGGGTQGGGLENMGTRTMLQNQKNAIDDVYRKYGFKNKQDFDDQLYAAEDSGNQAEADRLLNLGGLHDELKNVANTNATEAANKANAYTDYRKNSYVGQKVNQDAGKYLGDAINTWSTMADVAGMASGAPFLMIKNRVAGNALQGALGGVANELSQNGFENFDWGRAGQNAVIGGISGAATAGLNQKWQPRQVTGNGGLRDLATKAINSQIGRGAVSGALGGAIGGGLSAGFNNGDVMSGALQGAGQGAISGASSAALMQGAGKLGNAIVNRIDKTGGLANRIANNQQAYNKWLNAGNTFNERLNNTIASGESTVGNWLTKGGMNKLAERGVGLSIRNTAPVFDRQNGSVDNNLAAIRDSIKNENVSYDESAYLKEHMADVVKSGDTELMQWAGVPEFLDNNVSVRDWYIKNYPDDAAYLNIDPDMTFDDYYNAVRNGDWYAGGVDDSVVRERLFESLDELYGDNYRQDSPELRTTQGANSQERVTAMQNEVERLRSEIKRAETRGDSGRATGLRENLARLNGELEWELQHDDGTYSGVSARARALGVADEYVDPEIAARLNTQGTTQNVARQNLIEAHRQANYSKEDPNAKVTTGDIQAALSLGINTRDIDALASSRGDFWDGVVTILEAEGYDNPVLARNYISRINQLDKLHQNTYDEATARRYVDEMNELNSKLNNMAKDRFDDLQPTTQSTAQHQFGRSGYDNLVGNLANFNNPEELSKAIMQTGLTPAEFLDNLTDDNYHSERVLAEAIMSGNPEYVNRAKQILADHNHDGYLASYNMQKRDELVKEMNNQPSTTKQAVSVADFQEQGLGPRKAEQEAYKNLINGYFGEDSGYDSADGIANAILEAEGGANPQDDATNFAKARRMVENGFMAIYPEDELNELKSIYGDSFKESTYKNKDGSWKYKNGERYIDTIYKNKIAMALSHEMDARQGAAETPTAKDWAKQGLKRINEDLGEKGPIGLTTKDVSQEDNNPETVLFRKLTNGGTNTGGTTDNGDDDYVSGYGESGLATGKTRKSNLLSRLGRSMEASQAYGTRAENRKGGIVDAGDVIDNVRKRTGISNLETQAQLADELTGTKDALLDNIQKTALGATEDGSIRGIDLTEIMPEIDKEFDKISATTLSREQKAKIRSDILEDLTNHDIDTIQKANRLRASANNYFQKYRMTPEAGDRDKGVLYSNIADLIDEQTYNAIPQDNVDAMFETATMEMKQRANVAQKNGQKQIARAYNKLADEFAGADRTIENFRHLKKDFVDTRYLQSKSSQAATAWNNNPMVTGAALGTALLSSNPVTGILKATALKAAAPAVGQAANGISAKVGGYLADAGDALAEYASTPVTPANNNQLSLYNALGRNATENELGNNNANVAVANTGDEPVALLASNGPAYANDTTSEPTTEETTLYNSLNGGTTNTATVPTMGTYSAGTQSTGNSMADTLLGAMDRAANAGDADAFATLYQMYANAVSSTNSSKDMTNPVNWNSADRTKLINAQNGLSQIDTLANAYVNATGNGGDFVSGNLRNFGNMISGGNLDPAASNYNDLAQSVGMGIIKNLVNLGVTESDAERYKQYLPALTDSAEKAQMKLETLRQIYQDQINNLYSTYNA